MYTQDKKHTRKCKQNIWLLEPQLNFELFTLSISLYMYVCILDVCGFKRYCQIKTYQLIKSMHVCGYLHAQKYVCMHGWMDGRKDGWMDDVLILVPGDIFFFFGPKLLYLEVGPKS
jgi:hypothetical protein